MKICTLFCASLLLIVVLYAAHWSALNQGSTLESTRLSALHELIEREAAHIRTQLHQLQQTDAERGDTGSAVVRLH